MPDLTLKQLIEEANKRNIDLGDEPESIIKTCTRLGLIPKPRKKKTGKDQKKTELLYPKRTLEKLAYIKSLKSEGVSLDEIRDSFALMYVRNALQDLLSTAGDDKVKQLARIVAGKGKELESVVEAPLVYLIEGMSEEEAKSLLSLFCGVGFYSMLEAQKELEKFNVNEARRALFKSIFYNSIAVLRLARSTGDTKLEKTASDVYEKMVLEPINRASEKVRNEFLKSIEGHIDKKDLESLNQDS